MREGPLDNWCADCILRSLPGLRGELRWEEEVEGWS